MAETYGGEVIGKVLKEEGVKYFFGVQGGHLWGLLLGIAEQDIKMIHMRHEQAGAYAADAYARVSKSPGVCFGTAGPGMQNMTAAISQAWLCRSPVLALFAQHPVFEDGFQGLQVGNGAQVMKEYCKWTLRILDGSWAGYWIRKALRDIMTYPQEPVAIDLPPGTICPRFDEGKQRYNGWRGPVSTPPLGPADEELVEKAVRIMLEAERPVIVAGDGVYWSDASAELKELVELLQIPVNTRRMGRGAVPDDHPLALSSKIRSRFFREADAFLIIGHTLRYLEAYGASPPFGFWNADAKYVQVNEDPEDVCLTLPTELEVIGNTKKVLRQMIACAKTLIKETPKRGAWLGKIRDQRLASEEKTKKEEAEGAGRAPVHPATLGREVANFLDDSARDAIVVFDAFTGTSFFTDKLTSRFAGQVLDAAEQGGVGHGIGYAIGASIAAPGKPVLAYMGDMGIGIGGMDIETAVRYKLPIVYLVNCNGTSIAGIYDLYFENTKLNQAWEYIPNIRYDKMFEPLGCHTELVKKPEEIRPALERAFNSGITSVVNVLVDPAVTHPLNLLPIAFEMTRMIPPERMPEKGRKVLYPDFKG